MPACRATITVKATISAGLMNALQSVCKHPCCRRNSIQRSRAGDLTTLVPLPENILKAIAWAFNRANLNAEERESVFQVTDPVL